MIKTRLSNYRWSVRAAQLALAGILFTTNLHAGSHTWSGAVNGDWSNPGNWFSGGVPVAGETDVDLIFPPKLNVHAQTINNDIPGLTVRSMVFTAHYFVLGFGVTLAPSGSGVNFVVDGPGWDVQVSLPLTLPAGNYGASATGSSTLRFYGAISGPGSLHKEGSGKLYFGGAVGNTFTGGFQLRGGETRMFKQSGVALPGPVVVGISNSSVTAHLTYSADHQIADSVHVFVHGNLAHLHLDGRNDTIDSLTLVESRVWMTGAGSVGQLQINGTVTARQRVFANGTEPLISGRLHLGNVPHDFNVASNTVLYLNANIESSGVSGGIRFLGGGTTVLAGSNTFGGLLRIESGTVSVDHPHALGTTNFGTVLEGGRLIVDDLRHTFHEPLLVKATNSIMHCYGTNTWNGIIQFDPATSLTLHGPSFGTPDVWTLSGPITGAGNLNINSLEVDLVGASVNTYSGRTEIRGASVVRMNKTSGPAIPSGVIFLSGGNTKPQLRWKRDHQVADTARIEFPPSSDASGELYLENHNDTIGSLDNGFGALIACGTGTLTLGGDNLDGRFNGSLTGSAATNLIKIGTGAFTLSGQHTLSGKIVVNGGALILNNATGVGAVHVANGARLAGQGALGNLMVDPTASISPGTSLGGPSYGQLRPTSFNLGGGYLGMQLGGIHPGATHDQITAPGPVNLNGVLLQLSALNLPHGSNSFVLINVTNGAVTGNFTGLPEGEIFPSSDGKLFRITYQGGTGNDVVVTRHYPGPLAPTLTGITPLSGGWKQINGLGLPALTYQVQATTNFAPGSWVNLGITEADADFGTIQFIDQTAPNFPQRFYRLLLH
jgi:autotransporter-associated beta strand protein